MNNTTKYIVFSVAGLFIGILIMSVLSYRASKTHIYAIKSMYEQEQIKSAMQAMKNKNYFMAVHHYKNLVDTSSPNTKDAFHKAENIWSLSFPFASELLIKIKSHADPKGIGDKRSLGINHGMLAYAMEKYGMHNEAKTEWEKALKILEKQDINQVRELIDNINKSNTNH